MNSMPLPALATIASPAASPVQAEQGDSIARLTAGLVHCEDEAFRQFHDRYFDRLYCFLLVVTRGQREEAEDALQQTFLRVARYARQFQSEEIFWCWLKNLARSAARDLHRQSRRYSGLLERFRLSNPPSPTNHTPDENRWRELLEDTLASLATEEQDLARKRYELGLTVKEIADAAGASPKAIESRLTRLRITLREQILRRIRDDES